MTGSCDPAPSPIAPASRTARFSDSRRPRQESPTRCRVAGVVRDTDGGVIGGALVIVRVASGAERQTLTDASGRFTLTAPVAGDATVIVRMDGFAESRQPLAASASRQALEIVLQPAGISETVTVTPTRSEQRLGDVPASVTVISREKIRQSPAIVADDVLRQLPTFSLFRRTSSVSAHPTTQGVSLRGIGPSGVSRTLVLLDGVPFNDAVWRLGLLDAGSARGVERIEVVDGASSNLYGTYAMGGVINIVTSPPARRTFEMKAQYGNRQSPKLDLRGSDVWGKVGVAVDGSVFDTDGYPNVVAINPAGVAERGPIDNNVTVNFRNLSVKLDYNPTRPRAGLRPRRLFPGGTRQREDQHLQSSDRGSQRHHVEDGKRRRPPPVAGLERSPGDACSPTSRRSAATSWLLAQSAEPAAEHRPHDAQSARARQLRGRHGPMVEGVW